MIASYLRVTNASLIKGDGPDITVIFIYKRESPNGEAFSIIPDIDRIILLQR